MEGGEDVMNELKKERQGGLPWMVILNADGNELVTSNDGEGNNVGCPALPHEVKHFVDMIKQSSEATEEELSAINDALQVHAQKIKDASEARKKKAEEEKSKKNGDA